MMNYISHVDPFIAKHSRTSKPGSRFRLLKAARTLFSEHGYDGTQIQDICRVAELGRGTFYRQFDDKLDCFLAFTAEATAELEESIQQDLSETMTLHEGLHTMLCRSCDYSLANPGILRAILVDVRVLSSFRRSSPLLSSRIPSLIEKWAQQGKIANDLDADLLSYLLPGLINRCAAFVGENPNRREEVIDTMLCLVMRAIGPDRVSAYGRHEAKVVLSAIQQMDLTPEFFATAPNDTNFSQDGDNRSKLFSAARLLFSQNGYDSVGSIDIANLAGVGVGTFYSHFEDKLDCFFAVAAAAADELHDLGNEKDESAESFSHMIALFLKASFDYSAANSSLYSAILADAKSMSTSKNAVTWKIERNLSCIEQWKRMGMVDAHFDSKLLICIIRSTLRQGHGYIMNYPDTRQQTIENMLMFILRAIAKN